MEFAIGIDIGGTKIAAGLVTESGELVHKERYRTDVHVERAVEYTLVEVIQRLAQQYQVIGAAITAPGFLSKDRSIVYSAPNLNWRNEPIRDRLMASLDVPLLIENDANAAAWAEYRFGAGNGIREMAMLTIGTGIGGAIISDGKLFTGGFGSAGELGHMRIVQGGRLCGCGASGCFEQYGSGNALLRNARALAASDDVLGPELARYIRQGKRKLTGKDLARAISERNPGALKALAELGEWIGQGVASLSAILDSELIVIGGGVSATGEPLLAAIQESYRRHMPAVGLRPELSVRLAELGNDAGIVGVADMMWQRHKLTTGG